MTDLIYGLVAAEMMRVGDDDAAAKLKPCSSSECIYLARWTCHWPGDTCVKCERCRVALSRVAEALGFDLPSTAIDVPIGPDDTAKRFSLLELH